MENQDHTKNSVSGHECHVCHKCGWHYPNQNPSARRRRAHKKVCGTLERSSSLDSEDARNSDDEQEHHSHDDCAIPSAKPVETDVKVENTVDVVKGLNKREDDKSLDAEIETAESRSSLVVENFLGISTFPADNLGKNIPDGMQSPKDGPVSGLSDYNSKIQNLESTPATANLSDVISKSEDHITTSTISATASSFSEFRTEEHIDQLADHAARIKDDGVRSLDFATLRTSFKDINNREEDSENMFELSLPDDLTVVGQDEDMIRGFKEIGSCHSLNLASCELTMEQENNAKDSLLGGEVSHLQSRDSNGSATFSGSGISASENYLIFNEVSAEKEADVIHISAETSESKVSDGIGSEFNSLVTDREKYKDVCSPGDKKLSESCKELENANMDSAVAQTVSDTLVTSNMDRLDDADDKERSLNCTIRDEPPTDFDKCQENPVTNVVASDNAADHETGKVQEFNDGVEADFASTSKENVALIAEIAPITTLHEPQIVSDGVLDVFELDVGAIFSHLSKDGYEVHQELLQMKTENLITEEQLVPHLDTMSSVHNVTTVNKSLSAECDDSIDTQKIGTSTVDVLADSGSLSDSLEGNWGSISVLSTQSDVTANTEGGPFPSTDSRASAIPDKNSLGNQKVSTDDKSEMFEAPSFMTLVKRGGERGDKESAKAESLSVESGWFPSLTNVTNESEGRKRNEQIIAKVTNWSTARQHGPLKTLLSDAKAETKLNKDAEAITKDYAYSTKTDAQKPDKEGAGKESDSPAEEIETDKRKVKKGRPYWAPLVCCSSVK